MKAKKFLKQRTTQIAQQLIFFCDSKEPEILHNFRVELKKLKAFYLFLEYCDHHFKQEKKFKLHRKMFRQSSLIRDYDVMQELMKKNKINFITPSTVPASRKQRHKIKGFCNDISFYREALLKEKKELKPFIRSVTKSKLRKYLLKKKETVIEQLNNKPIEKKLHKVRKNIKQIIYLSKLDKHFSAKEFSQFDKLQKDIGDWHDNNILIIELQKTPAKQKNKILEKLKKERTGNLQKINLLKSKFLS